MKHFDWKKNACYETTTLQRVNHSRKSQTGGGKKLESDEKKKCVSLASELMISLSGFTTTGDT